MLVSHRNGSDKSAMTMPVISSYQFCLKTKIERRKWSHILYEINQDNSIKHNKILSEFTVEKTLWATRDKQNVLSTHKPNWSILSDRFVGWNVSIKHQSVSAYKKTNTALEEFIKHKILELPCAYRAYRIEAQYVPVYTMVQIYQPTLRELWFLYSMSGNALKDYESSSRLALVRPPTSSVSVQTSGID